MKYEVFYVADINNRRDYRDRQTYANEQGADVYVEFHFNASAYDKDGVMDNPASVLVCDNASSKSRQMAADYAEKVSKVFDYPNRGVVTLKNPNSLGSADRGYYNLYYTRMKAFLIEPLFISDVDQASVALSPGGQQKLAELLVDVIKDHYPEGAKCAFSLGHKYKASSIHDRGAPVVVEYKTNADGERIPVHHPTLAEADLAEKVMHWATEFLINDSEKPVPPSPSNDHFVCPHCSKSLTVTKA